MLLYHSLAPIIVNLRILILINTPSWLLSPCCTLLVFFCCLTSILSTPSRQLSSHTIPKYVHIYYYMNNHQTVKGLRLPHTCKQVSLLQFRGCWQRTQDSWVGDNGLYYSWHIKFHELSDCISFFCIWSLTRVTPWGSGGCCAQCGVSSKPRSLELREHKFSVMGCKQTYPTFALEGDSILLYSTVNKSSAGDSNSIFQGDYTNIFEKTIWDNYLCLCSQDRQKHGRPTGNYLTAPFPTFFGNFVFWYKFKLTEKLQE